MSESLSVLIIEDSEDDTLLVLRELRRNTPDLAWERVETAEELRAILKVRSWDVIISDYTLPKLNAPTSLEIVKQSQLDIPFIVVAGSIGESLAVEMMRAGAHDYVMKESLARLPEAVRREVRDAQIRAERRQAEITVKRQLAAIEAAIDGIGVLQGETYLSVNRAYLRLFGYGHPKELVGKAWKILYSPEEIERFEREIFPVLIRDRAWQGEAIATRKDGSTFPQGISLTLTEDNLLISVCRDISALKQAQDMLLYNALHDPLTGLPNRELLVERLELAISRAKRFDHYRYAVLFLDLDRFKVINDSLGHAIGDQLLIAIAHRLKRHLRSIDLVARLGGDEFVILMEEVANTETVIQVAERLIVDCQTPLKINDYEIFSSFSIGIVVGTKDYQQAADLIRDADIAMYQAKSQKKRSYKFFDTIMHTQVVNRLTLENDLRKAIEQSEFVLHYQPIFNLLNHQLVGFEALVRWLHPTRGLLSPREFVPIAEETGLIVAIDSWVLHEACQQIVTWERKFSRGLPLKISTNLSVQDLRSTNLIDKIDDILSATELRGNLLTLEVTESMAIEDIEQTIDLLTQLRSRNIQISIDDFGTGYSSLSYLHRLPVHTLKIDCSFVRQMQEDDRKYQIVSTIVTLGNQLGLIVIAEGIETSQQLQQLQQLDCKFGQGYLFSYPLASHDIEKRFLVNPEYQPCYVTGEF